MAFFEFDFEFDLEGQSQSSPLINKVLNQSALRILCTFGDPILNIR